MWFSTSGERRRHLGARPLLGLERGGSRLSLLGLGRGAGPTAAASYAGEATAGPVGPAREAGPRGQ